LQAGRREVGACMLETGGWGVKKRLAPGSGAGLVCASGCGCRSASHV